MFAFYQKSYNDMAIFAEGSCIKVNYKKFYVLRTSIKLLYWLKQSLSYIICY